MLFNLFKSKSKLGVDIGTSSIKVIELSKQGGRFVLDNYGIFELKGVTANAADAQSILKLPDEEIVWGIKEVLKAARIKSRNAIASISSFSTFATVIEMPYLSEQDLAKAIPFEARKYVPIPLDEVILDWSIVGIVNSSGGPVQSLQNKPATVEVFIAAVPKDETARYQRIMKSAGLNLTALELENAGLVRALLGNDLSPTAIVNIGGRSTSIVIVNKGYERLNHNYEIGGFEITKAVTRSLNVSWEKAEELKRKLGLTESNENIIKEAMISLIDMMIFETKKTITSYEESKNVKVGRVVLVGGLVNMPDFVNYFKQRLGRDVYIGNVFARIIHPQELTPVIQELSNNFSVASGLAMREV
ncbi:MAG: type IV pilus assembly protein PilM [Candidatus Yanofskybacteria bacterium]|nr:type IV pilus assembly protein PilM [Candidatus Yanofskybacteria bacterium]